MRLRYTDYRRAGASRQKTMTLIATEFIRRMLLHAPPPGFHRIRYYGFLANCTRQQKLAECGACCTRPRYHRQSPPARQPSDYRDRYAALTDSSLRRCPRCDDGNMRINQFVATAVAEKVSALRTAAFLSYRASRVDAARRVLRRGGGHPP